MEKRNILGVSFDIADIKETYKKIDDMLTERRNVKIFTPNAEILYRAQKDEALLKLLRSADILLPDGVGVLLASHLTGTPLPCRITGIDTAEHILSVANRRGLSVFLLGGREGVAEKAAARLIEKMPRLRICGTHHGYFDTEGEENDEVLRLVANARPDILFVCLGFPAQEIWIEKNTPALPFLRLSAGLGGSLDVWSGQVRRAPRAMQKLGLEWLFRSFTSVARISRLKYVFLFMREVIRDSVCMRKESRLSR